MNDKKINNRDDNKQQRQQQNWQDVRGLTSQDLLYQGDAYYMDKEDFDYLWLSRDHGHDEATRQLDKLLAKNNESKKILWDRLTREIGLLDKDEEYLTAKADNDPDTKLQVVFKCFDKLQAVQDGWRDVQNHRKRTKDEKKK
eukprot:2907603-Amphidinium_carterae.1